MFVQGLNMNSYSPGNVEMTLLKETHKMNQLSCKAKIYD